MAMHMRRQKTVLVTWKEVAAARSVELGFHPDVLSFHAFHVAFLELFWYMSKQMSTISSVSFAHFYDLSANQRLSFAISHPRHLRHHMQE